MITIIVPKLNPGALAYLKDLSTENITSRQSAIAILEY